MQTVLELLTLSTEYLTKRGINSARFDAELLLAELLNYSRTQLYMKVHDFVEEADKVAYREQIVRRGKFEPVAYILKKREFWSLSFIVSPAVLVPRPETEHLVESVLKEVKLRQFKNPKIIDVGTGSGCIAIAIATELPDARILALDISSDALRVAAENAEKNHVRSCISFRRGDLLLPLIHRPNSADIIVSNPPYIAKSEQATLMKDVLKFEPSIALFAEENGLIFIRKLAAQAKQILSPQGTLFVEFGSTQGEAVKKIMSMHFKNVTIFKDYSKHDRWVRASF